MIYIKSSGRISGLGENSCLFACLMTIHQITLKHVSSPKTGENPRRTSQHMFRGRSRASDTTNSSFLGAQDPEKLQKIWAGLEVC